MDIIRDCVPEKYHKYIKVDGAPLNSPLSGGGAVGMTQASVDAGSFARPASAGARTSTVVSTSSSRVAGNPSRDAVASTYG